MNYMIFHPGGNVAIVVDTVVYDIAVALEKFPDITNDLVASGQFMEDGVLVGDHYYTGSPGFQFTLNMYNDYPEEYLVQDVANCAKEFGATLDKRQFNWCYLSCYTREDAVAFMQWCQTNRPGWLVVIPEEEKSEPEVATVEEPEVEATVTAESEEPAAVEQEEPEAQAAEEPAIEGPQPEVAVEQEETQPEVPVVEVPEVPAVAEPEPEMKAPVMEEPEVQVMEEPQVEAPVMEEQSDSIVVEAGESEMPVVEEPASEVPVVPEQSVAKEVMVEETIEAFRPIPADAVLDEKGIAEAVITPSMSLEEAEAFVDQPEEEEVSQPAESFVVPEECRGETWAQTWKHCRPQDVTGDVFCVEKNWEKRGDYYIIDCVMTGMRLIHSDKCGVNLEVSAKECR